MFGMRLGTQLQERHLLAAGCLDLEMVVRPAEEEGDDGGWRRSGASGRRRLTKKKCFWDAAAGGVGGDKRIRKPNSEARFLQLFFN
ncbi:hypothetical protein R6Q59_011121 [Mikania micrantha]